MKKFLLFLAMATVGTIVSYGANYTIKFATGNGDGTKITDSTTVSSTVDTSSQSYVEGSYTTNSSAAVYSKSTGGLKFGASSSNGEVTFSLSKAGQISASGFKISRAAYGSDTNETIKITLTTDNSTVSYTTDAMSSSTQAIQEFTFDSPITITKINLVSGNSTTSGKKRGYVGSIEIIEATGGNETTVAAPTISNEEGLVTLTANANGDAIYYTVDGSNPKESSTAALYSAPFSVTRGATVQAVSKDAEGNYSGILSKTITWTLKVNSLGDFLTKSEYQAEEIIFNFPVTAIYQNGSNLYVTDGEDYVVVYGSLGQTYKNGDVIPAGFKGKYTLFGESLIEIGSPSGFLAGTSGAAVEPKTISVAEIASTPQSTYVTIKNATIAAYSGKSSTITDGEDNSAVVYDSYSQALAGKKDFTGFIGTNKNNPQFVPVSAVDCTEAVVAPEDIAVSGAEVDEGMVEIESGTVITFKSLGATSMTIKDKTTSEVIASKDGDTITFTPEDDCEIIVTATNAAGSATTELMVFLTYTLGDLTVNGKAEADDANIEIEEGTKVVFAAKNAQKLDVVIDGEGDENDITESVEDDTYEWTATATGEYDVMVVVTGSNSQENTYEYTITVTGKPELKPWIRVKHQSEIVPGVEYAVVADGSYTNKNGTTTYTAVLKAGDPTSSVKYFGADNTNVKVEEDTDILAMPEATGFVSFEKAESGYYLLFNNKYVNFTSGATTVSVSETNKTVFVVSYDNGYTSITHKYSDSDIRHLAYNPAAPRFAGYQEPLDPDGSSKVPVYLYYQEGSQASMSHVLSADGKVVTWVNSNYLDQFGTITLSARQGHDIYYKFVADGQKPAEAAPRHAATYEHTPADGYELYDGQPITLTEKGSLSHYTVYNGKVSAVNTLTVSEVDPATTSLAEVTAEKAAAIYDLQGRRVSKAGKGLYIQGGKVVRF